MNALFNFPWIKTSLIFLIPSETNIRIYWFDNGFIFDFLSKIVSRVMGQIN